MIKVLHFVTVMDRAGQETFIMNVYRSADRTKYKFVFLCDTNRKGDYDDEIIDVPQGMRAMHVGVFQYQTNQGTDKTVPVIKIM